MTELLRLTDVVKTFGGVRALRGVSFDLRPGEVHALIGENGAGKSTLMRIITGAHAPDSGAIVVNGQVLARNSPGLSRSLGIAPIYQQPALFPDLTVAENIALRLERRGGMAAGELAAAQTDSRRAAGARGNDAVTQPSRAKP